jgi:hypothetical protein
MSIHENISAFLATMTEHDRNRSWEHYYRYFHSLTPSEIGQDRDHAALQLGFYLASWGMYRPSGFLFKYDYTVHLGVIDRVVYPQFDSLWSADFGARESDTTLMPIILEAIKAIREAYKPFARKSGASSLP